MDKRVKLYEASAISDRQPVADNGLEPGDRPTWPFVIWNHDVRTKAVAAGADRSAVDEILDFKIKDGSTRATHWWLSHETPEGAVAMLVDWARDLMRGRKFENEARFMRNAIKNRGF